MIRALCAGKNAMDMANFIFAISRAILRPPASDALRGIAASAPAIRAAVEALVAFDSGKSLAPTLVLVAVFCASNVDSNAGPAGLPDPSAGQIEGKVAMTVAPQAVGQSGALSPWGFVAHLTGYDDPNVDIEFPCGIWSQPPRGRYRVWVEGVWEISPFTYIVRFSPQRFRGSGLIAAAPVGEAGRVALPPDVPRNKNLALRLLHAGSYLEQGYPRWELSRRKPVSEVGEGLLMPVGPTIGALWDEHSQTYVALSRPFEVKARRTVKVPLAYPSEVTDLVVQIQRHTLASDAADAKMKILLRRNGKKLPPDLQVSLADRAYAFWYGLAPGPGELRAETKDALVQTPQLNLVAGRIERRFETMTPHPAWPITSNQ
jgi:hypothetical protein